MAWDFWKREWLVYQAPWIRGLREGLVAPRCFGSGELAETAVWVAMEDLTAANQRPWSLSTSRRLRDIWVSSTVGFLSAATNQRTGG